MNSVFQECLQMGYPPIACFLTNIMVFINSILVPFIMALAFIVFIWGVFQYFIAGGADEEKRKQGRDFVMWGLIGFVIILSVWGLVNLIMASLGLRAGTRPPLPTFGEVPGAPVQERNPFNNSRSTQTAPRNDAIAKKASGLECSGASAGAECQSGACVYEPNYNIDGGYLCQ